MKYLSIVVFAMAGISLCQAQDEPYELITTAIHRNSNETALPVTVLTGDELHAAAKSTIGDTLANQPGINNASFGPAVGQTVIRGQQGRRVMSMTNGIPNADASGNSADHAVTVEAILADSIEVLRGPATLLYGGGAIGGVVNVIDNRIPQSFPDQTSFAFEGRHDSASDLNNLVGRVDFKTGKLAWHFDAMQRTWNDLEIPGFAVDSAYLDDADEIENIREGVIENTAGKTESTTLGFSYIFDNGFIGLAVNKINNNYGLPNGAHEHSEDGGEDEAEAEESVLIDMQRIRYDLSGEWGNITPWFERINYRLSFTEYEHVEVEGPGIIGTRFNNDSWQQRVQASHLEFKGWHGVFGWQISHERFGAVGEESFIPTSDINSNGLFLVEDLHIGNFIFELGARVNWDELKPVSSIAPAQSFRTYSFSATGLWDISSPVTLGLALSHSERPPSVEELYSNFGLTDVSGCVIHLATSSCELGDVNFAGETSNNIDFTIYLDYGKIDATITAFYNVFDDYIFQGNTGIDVEGVPVRSYQQTDATFTGLEVDINFSLSENLELRVFSDMTRGELGGNGDAPRMPPKRFGSQLNLNVEQWSSYISVLYASRQNKPGNNELSSDSYTRWDIGVDYSFKLRSKANVLLYVKGRNLGNTEIRLSSSFLRGFAPESGRSIEAGIRYQY